MLSDRWFNMASRKYFQLFKKEHILQKHQALKNIQVQCCLDGYSGKCSIFNITLSNKQYFFPHKYFNIC